MSVDRLILALDVPEPWPLVAQLAPPITFFKVGLELFSAGGPTVVRQLKTQNLRVFLDLKLHDIPNTVARTCQVLSELGVDLITLHASGGRTMLSRAAAAVAGTPTRLLAVTLLTSLDQAALRDELRVPLNVADYILAQAQLAQACGIHGVVASPLEAALLRAHCGPDFLIVTPGIRTQTSAAHDQQRTSTPRAALDRGADFLVVGRTTTAEADPAQALQRLVADLA